MPGPLRSPTVTSGKDRARREVSLLQREGLELLQEEGEALGCAGSWAGAAAASAGSAPSAAEMPRSASPARAALPDFESTSRLRAL